MAAGGSLTAEEAGRGGRGLKAGLADEACFFRQGSGVEVTVAEGVILRLAIRGILPSWLVFGLGGAVG